jgi:hypothetical protein
LPVIAQELINRQSAQLGKLFFHVVDYSRPATCGERG